VSPTRAASVATILRDQKNQMALRVFIVEDNPLIRTNLIETLVELAAIEVVSFSNGALESNRWLQANRDAWDLAVVDLFLAEGNGLAVLGAIRERSPLQRVVVLSNYATPNLRARCAALGADAVFDKSTELDAFLDYVRIVESGAA
jgi:two-component system OmpR family response regulator